MSKPNIIKQAVFALPAGLLLVACAGPDYEAGYAIEDDTRTEVVRVEETGFQESSGAAATYSQPQASQPAAQQQQFQAGQEFAIPLHEEQMHVGKQQVKAGQVTVRKTVTTQTVSQPVELRRETLIIDRSGAAQAEVSAAPPADAAQQQAQQQGQQISEPAGAAAPFQEQTYTIELFQEQPVVQKKVVQTGKVSAHKAAQMETQNVQQQVRREDIQLDKSGNVQIQEISSGQQLQEPAGAQPTQQQKDIEMELRRQEELQKSEPGEDNSTRGGARDLQQYDNPTDDRFDHEENLQ
jgi:stress response protein YsnF